MPALVVPGHLQPGGAKGGLRSFLCEPGGARRANFASGFGSAARGDAADLGQADARRGGDSREGAATQIARGVGLSGFRRAGSVRISLENCKQAEVRSPRRCGVFFLRFLRLRMDQVLPASQRWRAAARNFFLSFCIRRISGWLPVGSWRAAHKTISVRTGARSMPLRVRT